MTIDDDDDVEQHDVMMTLKREAVRHRLNVQMLMMTSMPSPSSLTLTTNDDLSLQARLYGHQEVVQSTGSLRETLMEGARKEIFGLTEGTGALRPLSDDEAMTMMNEGAQEVYSRLVWQVKTRYDDKGHKATEGKLRWTIGGDKVVGDESDENGTTQIDATTLRTMAAVAAHRRWSMAGLDVSMAFLNAPLHVRQTRPLLLKTPAILLTMGLVPYRYSLVQQAVYGLRTSPAAWERTRDLDLEAAMLPSGLRLVQSETDRCSWTIESSEGLVVGALATYVDDILVVGEDAVLDAVVGVLGKVWKCGKTQVARFGSNDTLVFTGIELRASPTGYFLHQAGYIRKMLLAEGLECCNGRHTPMEEFDEPLEEDRTSPAYKADLRRAQELIGGLLWASTRTRPDVSYSVGTLGSFAVSSPAWTCEKAKAVLRYLAATSDHGLHYGPMVLEDSAPQIQQEFAETRWKRGYSQKVAAASDVRVDIYSDASFAPHVRRAMQGNDGQEDVVLETGLKAVTGVAVLLGGSLVSWMSKRQAVVASSTAEAELNGQLTGLHAAMGLSVILDFFKMSHHLVLRCDSKAAIQIIKGSSTRSRHLAIRAAVVRSHVLLGVCDCEFVGTDFQLADFLTKPLGKVKLASFLPQVSLGSSPTGDKEKMTTTKKTVVKAKMMTVSEMAANTLAKTLANAMATAITSAVTNLPTTSTDVGRCDDEVCVCPPRVDDENNNNNRWWWFGGGAVAATAAQAGYRKIRSLCTKKRKVRDAGGQAQCTYVRREGQDGHSAGKFQFLGHLGVNAYFEHGAERDD